MRRLPTIVPITLMILVIILLAKNYGKKPYHEPSERQLEAMKQEIRRHEPIHLVTVICDADEAQHAVSLVNSAIFMSNSELNFLPKSIQIRVKFVYHEMQPSIRADWNTNNVKCMLQRALIPDILKDVDKVIYLNPTIVIVGSLESMWAQFKNFDQNHIMGASNDCPLEGCGYFSKIVRGEAHVPTVWESGLNSAVLFLKLDTMRKLNVVKDLTSLAVSKEYEKKIVYIDQDMYNIYFANSTKFSTLKHMDCVYNFMPWFYCNEPNICDTYNGLYLINGSGDQFKDGALFDYIKKKFHDMNFHKNPAELYDEFIADLNEFKARDQCPKLLKYMFWK